jgi:hypothetical protein
MSRVDSICLAGERFFVNRGIDREAKLVDVIKMTCPVAGART